MNCRDFLFNKQLKSLNFLFLYNYSREKLSQLYTNYDFLIYSLFPSPVENERKGFNMTNLWHMVKCVPYSLCLFTSRVSLYCNSVAPWFLDKIEWFVETKRYRDMIVSVP